MTTLEELEKRAEEASRLWGQPDFIDGRFVLVLDIVRYLKEQAQPAPEGEAERARKEADMFDRECTRLMGDLLETERIANLAMSTGLARCKELEATVLRKHEDGYAWAQAYHGQVADLRAAQHARDELSKKLTAATARIAELERDIGIDEKVEDTLRRQRDGARAESERLRNVIRTGGAAYRLERAAMGIPGGHDEDDASLLRADLERVTKERDEALCQRVTRADLDTIGSMIYDIKQADKAIARARDTLHRGRSTSAEAVPEISKEHDGFDDLLTLIERKMSELRIDESRTQRRARAWKACAKINRDAYLDAERNYDRLHVGCRERIAQAVQAEREACARVCDDIANAWIGELGMQAMTMTQAMTELAAKFRARGEGSKEGT